MLIFNSRASRKLPRDIQDRALQKLRMINASAKIEDLKNPPGNRLEALKGDKREMFSIRINDQWRICFRWERDDAYDVEICDYH